MTVKIEDIQNDHEIVFETRFMVEIFEAPLPALIESEMGPIQVDDEQDLFRMSNHYGFDELFIDDSDSLKAQCGDHIYQVAMSDFLRWQLERMNAYTLLHLIDKTEADVLSISGVEELMGKETSSSPYELLDVYNFHRHAKESLSCVNQMRNKAPDAFYSLLIDSLIDESTGILNRDWLEFEINDDLPDARQAYKDWDVPLMLVYKGCFSPYIAPENNNNLMMDDWALKRVYVRNYDEGEANL